MAKKKSVKKTAKRSTTASEDKQAKPRCGLCGKSKKLTKTECCGNWICDDEQNYVMFSYAHNSCSRNHGRYTLCSYHFNEGHKGSWKDCQECRESFEAEMYVYYGTNEYNFETLDEVPQFQPTKCSKCGRTIVLTEGGYLMSGSDYTCGDCSFLFRK